MYVFGEYKFECFAYFAWLSCVSHSIDICTVAIKNMRNTIVVSTNQMADILDFNDIGSAGAENSSSCPEVFCKNFAKACNFIKSDSNAGVFL